MSRRRAMVLVRFWLLVLLAAPFAAGPAAAQGGTGVATTQWPTLADQVGNSDDFTAEGLTALNARMREAVEKGEVAGLAHILLKDGEVVTFDMWGAQSFGGPPITEETIYRIRSMTKPIVGVAMMQLYEQGLWRPEDPITKFLPEMANLRVVVDPADLSNTVPVTRAPNMNELMTHTAGFGYGLSAANAVDRAFQEDSPSSRPDLDGVVSRTAEIPLLFQPGERWSYSIAVDLQGAIVERLTGQSLGEYLEEHIFGPLGMEDTGFAVPEADRGHFATVSQRNSQTAEHAVYPDAYSFFERTTAESGGGGLVSTTHDYARFAQMLLNEGELDGARILDPASIALMMTNHIGDLRGVFGGGGFGYGGRVVTAAPENGIGEPVGSFSWFGIDGTWMWIDPVNDLAYIGMIQRRGGGGQGAVNFRGESPVLVYGALRR
ncbi:MAG: serine hydrolase domain-containing protein [Gemmatimonadota bacterium]